MKIAISSKDSNYTIKLEGFLDTNSSPELQEKVENLSETHGKGGLNLIFDLADVSFLSSAGLHVLLRSKKLAARYNGKMTVINARDPIREVFDMTGFSAILNLQ